MALLVTTDFCLPLLHRTYRGNRPDPPTFQSLGADLTRRYREVAAGTETVTLVFDKGNNSRENLDWVEHSPFHFIGSLVPTKHPHLLDVSLDQMRSLEADGLPGVRAHRTECKVFGVQRTVLVTWNRRLFDAQCRTLRLEGWTRCLPLDHQLHFAGSGPSAIVIVAWDRSPMSGLGPVSSKSAIGSQRTRISCCHLPFVPVGCSFSQLSQVAQSPNTQLSD